MNLDEHLGGSDSAMDLFFQVALANESAAVSDELDFVIANAIPISDDGWAIIPYGDHPHEMGVQRLNLGSAQAMVNAFKSLAGKMRRVVKGLPVYNGHPDLADDYEQVLRGMKPSDPAYAGLQKEISKLREQYPDPTEYGHVSDMEARPDGLALKLVVGDDGESLIRKGSKFISPNWKAKLIGMMGKRMLFSPSLLQSVGLTWRPNIPVPSLINSAAAAAAAAANHQSQSTMIPEWLKTLLKLGAEASDEQVRTAISGLQARPEAATLANEHDARSAAEGRVTALTDETSRLKAKLTDAETALANERKSRIDGAVADAVRAGTITEADRSVWISRLTANFSGESAVLANMKPTVKTASEIPAALKRIENEMRKSLANAAGKKADGAGSNDDADGGADDEDGDEGDDDEMMMNESEKGARIKELVNAEKAKLVHHVAPARLYNQAFSNVKRAHPGLFKSAAAKA